jgi:hypothetical protein
MSEREGEWRVELPRLSLKTKGDFGLSVVLMALLFVAPLDWPSLAFAFCAGSLFTYAVTDTRDHYRRAAESIKGVFS